MKIQIRRGVFETNSSSTHSLQITKGSIDSVRDNIFKAIIEQYKENIDNDMFNPLLCIDKENKTFTLTGIYFEMFIILSQTGLRNFSILQWH